MLGELSFGLRGGVGSEWTRQRKFVVFGKRYYLQIKEAERSVRELEVSLQAAVAKWLQEWEGIYEGRDAVSILKVQNSSNTARGV